MSRELKTVEMRCDDGAENLVFTKYTYDNGESSYEVTLEDSYCALRVNRFKRAWRAFWAKPIYYSGIFKDDGTDVKKWLLDCLKCMEEA